MKFRLLSNDIYLRNNKENIAFIFYGNINKEEIKKTLNKIVYMLDRGNWVYRYILGLKIYVSDINICNIDGIGKHDKFFYIMKKQIRIPYKNTELFKIYDSKNIEWNNNNLSAYSFIEKKIDDNVIFDPYGDELIDENHLLDLNYYIQIEEIFAREEYKRHLYPNYSVSLRYIQDKNGKYKKGGDKILSAYEGYYISIIENKTLDNDVIKCINDYFNIHNDHVRIEKTDINNSIEALLNCYGLWENFIEDNSKMKLQNYSNIIENRLGKFKGYYKISNFMDIYGISLREPCCFLYEKAIVVVDYATRE